MKLARRVYMKRWNGALLGTMRGMRKPGKVAEDYRSTSACATYAAVRGDSLIQSPPDRGNSKFVCIADVLTLETEREPDIGSLSHVGVLMPSIWTAGGGSTCHTILN